jgi:hypothetical protein
MLFGPGVTDDTTQNVTRAISTSGGIVIGA